jgi:hypothetical protein
MNMVVRGHVLGLALAAAFCLVGHTAGSARNKALSWLFSAPHLQVPAPPPNIAAIVRVLPQMAFDPLKWIKPLDPQVIADYNSGNFYLISGKFEEAIETFSKVLEVRRPCAVFLLLPLTELAPGDSRQRGCASQSWDSKRKNAVMAGSHRCKLLVCT